MSNFAMGATFWYGWALAHFSFAIGALIRTPDTRRAGEAAFALACALLIRLVFVRREQRREHLAAKFDGANAYLAGYTDGAAGRMISEAYVPKGGELQ